MKAFRMEGPGVAAVAEVPDVAGKAGEALLRVEMVGMCGTDLNTFRGRNAMGTFPRVLGRGVAGGGGGVGLGAIASAAFRGAETIAIDMDDAKLEIARKAGAKHLVNTAREDLHARLAEITGGQGPDVMIEAIGLPTTFRAAVEEVAFTG